MVVVTSANISSSQAQANRVKHTEVHHGALTQAGTVASKKANKKSPVSPKKTASKSDKKAKSSKLRPQRDISNETSRASRSPDDQSSSSSKGSGGLFSTWGGDALSLFMFKVAPLIMRINFSLRTTLSEAQQSEVENQIKSANLSAQFTMNKGEDEAKQLTLQGASAIAGGVTGLAGMGQGALELGSTNGVMEDELAFQDKAMNDLSVSKEDTPAATPEGHGDIEADEDLVEETTVPRTPEEIAEQKAAARKLAKDYKAAREAKARPLQEEAEAKADSFKDKLAKSKRLGLGKKDAQIKLERNIEISKSSGAEAFKEVTGTEEGEATLQDIYDNPDIAAEFMDELGSSLGQPDAALSELRGMPGESTGKVLRSFGKSAEAEAFKTKLENTRTNSTARMAAVERTAIDRGMQKRQIIMQVAQGLAGGTTNLLSVDAKLDAASAESQATMANAQASVMASVRGAQEGTISGALDQVRGLMEWYAQMESQVIGAVSQSMA